MTDQLQSGKRLAPKEVYNLPKLTKVAKAQSVTARGQNSNFRNNLIY